MVCVLEEPDHREGGSLVLCAYDVTLCTSCVAGPLAYSHVKTGGRAYAEAWIGTLKLG